MSTRNLPLLLPPKDPTKRHVAHWATVTQVSPLRVKVDGEGSALGITPDLIIPAVLLNDRVLLQVINRRLCVVGRVATNMDLSGYVRAIRSNNAQGSFAAAITNDSVDRLTIFSDGKIQWGPGNGSQDTNLYRAAGSVLATDDEFKVIRTAPADRSLTAQISGEGNRRFHIESDGAHWWGPGNASQDVNLYRSAPSEIATDYNFRVNGLPVLRGESNWTLLTVTATTSVTLAVTFATAFPGRPNVVCNVHSAAGQTAQWHARAFNVTTTGFTIFIFGPSNTFTVEIMWLASLTQ